MNTSTTDLLHKLEAVRLVCQESGCAQRYLTQDALNAIYQTTWRIDQESQVGVHDRFLAYLNKVQDDDLTLGVAMTDAKGDRSKRPHEQANPNTYLHITERRAEGIVIRGTKAIVTAAPYVHEFLVMPCRNMTEADKNFAVCCAVPVDAEGITIIARPAGRPGVEEAKFSNKYGQSTGVVVFEDVFVPWDRVFLAGEWQHSQFLTTSYAAHHRLLIGAGMMMTEANGLDVAKVPHLRARMVDLIKIVEGFFACGIASSTYGQVDPSGLVEPERIYANIGKLLMSTQIYEMHRVAHEVSGGLVVALPGPEEDHNPETAGMLSDVLRGRDDIPYDKRMDVARMIEDLTASNQAGWYSIISLHGGGSPEAMGLEIFRSYPLQDKVDLVERLLDRGALADDAGMASRDKQPGRCCVTGCDTPEEAAQPPTKVRS
jgi:4-hydroxybutyryl-CoA dehydratase/vinylacetyl-CoA-Delta-isomerase